MKIFYNHNVIDFAENIQGNVDKFKLNMRTIEGKKNRMLSQRPSLRCKNQRKNQEKFKAPEDT